MKRKRKKIIKFFGKVGVPLDIPWYRNDGNRAIFKIKYMPGTTEKKIRVFLKDICQLLKLHTFQLHREGKKLFFVALKEKITDNRLLRILTNSTYRNVMRRMSIPYAIGVDVIGQPTIVDLKSLTHLLLGGSSNAGKTVGLQCLLTSIILNCSPSDVNLIIFDGASNLSHFDEVAHLSHPVVQDSKTGFKVIMELRAEMERRISIKNSDEFHQLPSIVLILDEFVSFISGVGGKQMARLLPEMISNILRRGRHAKIHVVLAAQDPVLKDMKCDISNATSRIAFTCAKLNYSMTILGEAGAEKLSGNGELYFKSPQHSGLKFLQGAYITLEEVDKVLQYVNERDQVYDDTNKFIVDSSLLEDMDDEISFTEVKVIPNTTKCDADDKLLANIIVWSLGRDSISRNAIGTSFNTGWRRADKFIEQMYKMEIIGEAFAKLPRKVLPTNVEDIPPDVVRFVNDHGYGLDKITEVFNARNAHGDDTKAASI